MSWVGAGLEMSTSYLLRLHQGSGDGSAGKVFALEYKDLNLDPTIPQKAKLGSM